MSFTPEALLKIAAAEIGYKEKKSNSQLDDPSANAGNKNFTKYARDLAAAGYYQASKQGYAWCDMFVDWCFLKLCGSKEKAEALICQTGLYGAGCECSARYYRNQGRFFTSDPKPGDQIFFDDYSHTGIVEKIVGNVITTIEGNTSDQVARRTYSVGSRSIDGYGRPKYDVKNSVETVEKLKISDVVNFTGSRHYISAYTGTGNKCDPGRARITSIRETAPHPYHLIKVVGGGSTVYGWVDAEDIEELEKTSEPPAKPCQLEIPTLKNGSEGATVKALQNLLIGNGFDLDPDGKFGDITESAVGDYQTRNKLPVSRIADAATWKKLLGV